METISFITNLLETITLLIFVIILFFDVKKRYNLKIEYAKFICISILILIGVAELIIRIIMKEDLLFTIVIILAWIVNLLLSISCIKSLKNKLCRE